MKYYEVESALFSVEEGLYLFLENLAGTHKDKSDESCRVFVKDRLRNDLDEETVVGTVTALTRYEMAVDVGKDMRPLIKDAFFNVRKILAENFKEQSCL